jgi:hypothetical protein
LSVVLARERVWVLSLGLEIKEVLGVQLDT